MASGDVPRQPTYQGLRTGGRSERVRVAVMEAALDQVVQVGFAELSMAQVAQGADVALTTVHRRWGTKAALVADCVVEVLRRPVAVPDLGSIEADFRAIAEAAAAGLRDETVTATLRAIMLLQGAELDRVRAVIDARFAEIAGPVMIRAARRKELDPTRDPSAVLELLLAGLWMRGFVSGGRLDERDVESFVADALAAVGREVHA